MDYKVHILDPEATTAATTCIMQTCKYNQWAIMLAQEDWKLLVDGIVTALRYNTVKSHFIAKLNYSNNGMELTEELIILVEWVSDVHEQTCGSSIK